MRFHLAFAAMVLPLAGCVVPPPGPPPPPYGYPPPGYPGVAPQADFSYPGFAYNGGSPVYVEGGITWPLIFFGGGWGYWDGYHRWHGAPGPVAGWLSARHPGGVGYHPYGGGQYGRPVGLGGPGGPRGYGPPGGARPVQPGGQRVGAPGAPRPAANRPPPQRHREEEHH